MPIISVIVPVYNVEKYLSRCIDSILSQTFKDFELILIDDGSLDNCPKICDEYAQLDKRIKVIHKNNEGVSIARNAGLDIAIGEYIAFCDSDDYWNIDFLEIMFKTITEKNVDVVCVNYSIWNENGSFVKTPQKEYGLVDTSTLSQKYEYIDTYIFGNKHGWEIWNRLFKSDIINTNNIRFPTVCDDYAEDLGFVLEYSLFAEKVMRLDYAGYNYILRSGSMMRNSVSTIKLNQMNNLSLWFFDKFNKVFADSIYSDKYSILHFLFMKIEYGKIIGTNNYKLLGKLIFKIENIEWYNKQIKCINKCKKFMQKRFGARATKQILLLSHYCRHKNWKRFTYESAIAYKFFIKG